MKQILLVGCGNIGSRHLQSLAKMKIKLTIQIIEPNKISQQIGKKRLAEIKNISKHKISWLENIEDAYDGGNFAIIATQASGRYDLIKKLLKKNYKKFLIEKMVCQSSKEYQKLLHEFKKYNAKAWVNTSRRYFQSYQKIKQKLSKQEVFHFFITGGNMGLGSNAIHYLDLFQWFLNQETIFLNGDFLSKEIYENKRGKDLLEFGGTILGKTNNGSTINVTFLPLEHVPLTIEICSNESCILINETHSYIIDYITNKKSKFTIEFQSNLTNKIVYDILTTGTSKLPSIEESYFIHTEIFRIFLKHLKKFRQKTLTKCPIT